jgi:hypothetical protein
MLIGLKSKPKPVVAAPAPAKTHRKAWEFTAAEVETTRLALQRARRRAVTGDEARAWLADPLHRPLSEGPK